MIETLVFISGTTGLTDLGIRFWDVAGDWVGARITSGITEQDASKGTYCITASVPATAKGVHWDSTGTPAVQGDETFDVVGYASLGAALSAVHGSGSWGSGGSGSGAYTITVTVTDGTDPLQNALVRVTEGVNSFTVTTDVNGQGQFSLDAATYTVSITKGGYSFTPTTRTVTGNEAGTLTGDLEMTAVAITPPSDPSLCRIFGTLYKPDGEKAVAAKVTATLVVRGNKAAKAGGVIVDRAAEAISDSDGEFTMDVVRTDAITPADCTWTIECEDANLRVKNVKLATTTKDIADLIP